jgi:hypothetical protein
LKKVRRKRQFKSGEDVWVTLDHQTFNNVNDDWWTGAVRNHRKGKLNYTGPARVLRFHQCDHECQYTVKLPIKVDGRDEVDVTVSEIRKL